MTQPFESPVGPVQAFAHRRPASEMARPCVGLIMRPGTIPSGGRDPWQT